MAQAPGRELVDYLREVEEIEIETRVAEGAPGRRRIIWVVVVDDQIYVRSVRGPAGLWYRDTQAYPFVTLRLAEKEAAFHAVPVTDATTIARVSDEFLRKYASSPHAPPIVRAETLPTTLRLEPG